MAGDIEAARRELTQRVMGQRGVSGTAIGEHHGKPCLKVYVSDREAERSLPESVGGYPVVAERTGAFERL